MKLNVKTAAKGRKQNPIVDTNEMLSFIESYLREHPNEPLSPTKLADASGIKRHYWYDREGIKKRIDDINKLKYEDYEIVITSSHKNLLQLPEVDAFVEENYNSKPKLKAAVSHIFGVLQDFFISACEKDELDKMYLKLLRENEQLKEELKKLKKDKDKFKRLADEYENDMKTMAIRSRETTYRKEKNIKENVIDINNKKVLLTTNSSELDELLGNIDI